MANIGTEWHSRPRAVSWRDPHTGLRNCRESMSRLSWVNWPTMWGQSPMDCHDSHGEIHGADSNEQFALGE